MNVLVKRRLTLAAIALVVVALGVQQVASMALLSPYASRFSLPLLLPEALGVTMYRALDRAPVPGPIAAPLRVTLARRFLAAGRIPEAQDVLTRLPEGPERADLRGMIEAARGQDTAAAEDFIDAGDDQRLTAIIDALAQTNIASALALQERLVERLGESAIPSPGLADAYWRLGILQATLGYVGKPRERAAANVAAIESYAEAVKLAPFSAKYLLALANQQANTGDVRSAVATFNRIIALDPHGKEAPEGIRRLEQAAPHS
jgi:tetratricopeptide (TPR) repeat protein